MLPIKFPQSNFTFGKPESMTDEQCGSLPVYKGKSSDNFPVIISAWKLSDEEIEKIKTTGIVYLTITGQGMPPVNLSIENPIE